MKANPRGKETLPPTSETKSLPANQPPASASPELREIAILRLLFQMNSRLRIEILGALSRAFREHGVSVSDNLLAALTFAVAEELPGESSTPRIDAGTNPRPITQVTAGIIQPPQIQPPLTKASETQPPTQQPPPQPPTQQPPDTSPPTQQPPDTQPPTQQPPPQPPQATRPQPPNAQRQPPTTQPPPTKRGKKKKKR